MKGVSVLVTMLLFVVAGALSNYLKKTGFVPQETGSVSASQTVTNSAVPRSPWSMASYIRNARQFRD